MGYRLEGPPVEHKAGADIVSDGIPPGAVQVPGDGLPIILLADRQTTGGYVKIATVSTVDLPKLAQARPGDRVRFLQVTEEEAYRLLREYEKSIDALKQWIQHNDKGL
jgi:allophanate hydrolase subunit 2